MQIITAERVGTRIQFHRGVLTERYPNSLEPVINLRSYHGQQRLSRRDRYIRVCASHPAYDHLRQRSMHQLRVAHPTYHPYRGELMLDGEPPECTDPRLLLVVRGVAFAHSARGRSDRSVADGLTTHTDRVNLGEPTLLVAGRAHYTQSTHAEATYDSLWLASPGNTFRLAQTTYVVTAEHLELSISLGLQQSALAL